MRRVLAVGGATVILLGATALTFDGRWPWRRLETPAPAAVLLAPPPTTSDTLRPGEALGDLFGRHGIGALDLPGAVRALGLDPKRLRAGLVFRFRHDDAGDPPSRVTVRTRADEELELSRGADSWTAERRLIRWSRRTERLEGSIETSLYDALMLGLASESLDEGDRIRLAWDLADVFAWEVDFTRDLQVGDRFRLVFERETSEFGELRLGRILAGEIELSGRTLSAYRFGTADGREQYYDADGASLRRAFLRAPVEFRRISSRFSRSRFHPILGVWRRHQGIDYAAASGTPVLAAGDGVVTEAAWSGGYGRLLELRHANGITTRYGHLRGFARGIRVGSRVQQGEVVAYVGSTGLATAAHLHYEFRQNGAARDPNRVERGTGQPVLPADSAGFRVERDRLRSLLRPVAPEPGPVVTGTD